MQHAVSLLYIAVIKIYTVTLKQDYCANTPPHNSVSQFGYILSKPVYAFHSLQPAAH